MTFYMVYDPNDYGAEFLSGSVARLTASPTNATTITFDLVFKRAVTGLTASDIYVYTGAGTAFPTGTPTVSVTAVSASQYYIYVSGMTSAGDIKIKIPGGSANAVNDGEPNVTTADSPITVYDNVAPTVTAYSFNGDTDIVANVSGTTPNYRTFYLDFSEPIAKVATAATKYILIKRLSDNATIQTIDAYSGVVDNANNRLSFNFNATLDYISNYYISIEAGAVTDILGNPYAGLTDNTLWRFTTEFGAPAAATNLRKVTTGLSTYGSSYKTLTVAWNPPSDTIFSLLLVKQGTSSVAPTAFAGSAEETANEATYIPSLTSSAVYSSAPRCGTNNVNYDWSAASEIDGATSEMQDYRIIYAGASITPSTQIVIDKMGRGINYRLLIYTYAFDGTNYAYNQSQFELTTKTAL